MSEIGDSSYRFPPEIIHRAIWLCLRFTLSLRDAEGEVLDVLVEGTWRPAVSAA